MINSIRMPDPGPEVPEAVVSWMTEVVREISTAIDDIRTQIQNYEVTNFTELRQFDATAGTLQQTKDTLATLIEDFRGRSIAG